MNERKISNPEQFRTNIVDKIDKFLNNKKNSINLEKGVFNYSLREANTRKVVKKWENPFFVRIYLDKLRSVYINIKDNKYISNLLETGYIKPHQIAFMTHQEMKPEKWDELIKEKIKRDKNKFETNIEAATDTFTCRRCKQNKCTYYQMQTRSADEPMTTFVTCLNCDNRWKC